MRLREAIAVWSGVAALAVSILALGGVLRPVQAVAAALVAAGLAGHVLSRRVFQRPPALLGVIGLAAGLTALQLLPLPDLMLGQLAPIGSALRTDGAELVGVSPWNAITLDTPGTLGALAFFVILLGVAVLALRVSTSERGRYRVLATVTALCGIASLVVGAHALLGLDKVYGYYEPVHAKPSMLGPLLNGNHMGCLMAVGTVLAAGLAMYRRQPTWTRIAWIVVLCGCGAVTLFSLSRGAAVALIAGATVATCLLVAQHTLGRDSTRRRQATFFTSSMPIGIVAACAVIVVLYASAGGVADQLSRTTLDEISEPRSKFAAWRSSTALIEESPWVGVGRGAFESAFTRVHPASAFSTFSHVENEYVQAVVDWGIPGAVALVVAALWFFWAALRCWRDGPLTAAALGAIVVVLLQSNVDFGVQLLGIAMPLTAIAATVSYVPLHEASGQRLAIARASRILHLLGLATLALLLLSDATTSVAEDHERLIEKRQPAYDEILESIERHPVDYFGYALAARELMRDSDRRAIRVLNHALTLHPSHPGLHLMAANLLYEAGHVEQATIEYAAALYASPNRSEVIGEILKRFPPELAARAIPAQDPRLPELVKLLEEHGRASVAADWLRRVIQLKPDRPAPCDALFDLAVRHVDVEITRIALRECQHFPPAAQTRLELARVLMTKAAYPEILGLLDDVESWRGRITEKRTAWLLICDVHIATAKRDEAKRCLRRLDAAGLVPNELASEITSRLEKANAVGTPPAGN